MNRAQGKLLAIYQKQESRLTRILGNNFKIQFLGAIFLGQEEDCNITRQGLMRSSSVTHCLQSH